MKGNYPSKLKHARSFNYEDEYILNPIGDFSLRYNPLNSLPDPLDSDLTPSPPPEQANFFSCLAGGNTAYAENSVFCEVDWTVFPPDILASLVAAAKTAPLLAPMPLAPPAIPTTPSITPFPSSPASVSPTTAYASQPASPPTSPRGSSPTSLAKESQQSTLRHSPPRIARGTDPSYPGESSFLLDPTVPPLKACESPDQPKDKPHVHPKYPMCRCPLGPTKKPPRHWDICPSNPERRKRLFPCESCGRAFSAKWNKDRHMKSCLRGVC